MTNAILYFTSLLLLFLALQQVRRVAQALQLPVTLSLCVCAGLLLYLCGLIPGIMGLLTPLAVGITLSLISFLTIWGLGYAVPAQLSTTPASAGIRSDLCQGPWNTTNLFIVVLASSGIILILKKFAVYFLADLLKPNLPLGWDTVSYHLPGFIEFLQAQSLWSLDGPYQSYSFGFELIAGFPSVFFYSHWGLVFANAYAVVFLLAGVFSITRCVHRAIGASFVAPLNLLIIYFLAIDLWYKQFGGWIGFIGKNDIFMTACILSTFGLVFEMSQKDLTTGKLDRQTALLFLTTASLGLAIATKPPALAYVPFFLLMVASLLHPRKASDIRKLLGFRIGRAALMGLGVLTIGGFFYLRNLLAFGQITDPALSEVVKNWTIIANLNNPALYVINQESVTFALALLTPLILLYLWWWQRKVTQASVQILWMLGFHITGLLAFVITPNSVFMDSLQPRLGMPVFSSMAITGAVVIGLFAARMPVQQWKVSTLKRVEGVIDVIIYLYRPLKRVAWATVLILLIFIPWWWTRNVVVGLPGYEGGVYQWVQGLNQPARIYSAGLRPYGLYGPKWRNRIFYDLNLSTVEPEVAGRSRLLTIIQDFHPDLILISFDPHHETGLPRKPLVNWMHSQTCFVEVYSDKTASAFKVRDGWQELLKQYPLLKRPIRMGA